MADAKKQFEQLKKHINNKNIIKYNKLTPDKEGYTVVSLEDLALQRVTEVFVGNQDRWAVNEVNCKSTKDVLDSKRLPLFESKDITGSSSANGLISFIGYDKVTGVYSAKSEDLSQYLDSFISSGKSSLAYKELVSVLAFGNNEIFAKKDYRDLISNSFQHCFSEVVNTGKGVSMTEENRRQISQRRLNLEMLQNGFDQVFEHVDDYVADYTQDVLGIRSDKAPIQSSQSPKNQGKDRAAERIEFIKKHSAIAWAIAYGKELTFISELSDSEKKIIEDVAQALDERKQEIMSNPPTDPYYVPAYMNREDWMAWQKSYGNEGNMPHYLTHPAEMKWREHVSVGEQMIHYADWGTMLVPGDIRAHANNMASQGKEVYGGIPEFFDIDTSAAPEIDKEQ